MGHVDGIARRPSHTPAAVRSATTGSSGYFAAAQGPRPAHAHASIPSSSGAWTFVHPRRAAQPPVGYAVRDASPAAVLRATILTPSAATAAAEPAPRHATTSAYATPTPAAPEPPPLPEKVAAARGRPVYQRAPPTAAGATAHPSQQAAPRTGSSDAPLFRGRTFSREPVRTRSASLTSVGSADGVSRLVFVRRSSLGAPVGSASPRVVLTHAQAPPSPGTAPQPPPQPPQPQSLTHNAFVTALYKLPIAELKELCNTLGIDVQYRYHPVTKDQLIEEVLTSLPLPFPEMLFHRYQAVVLQLLGRSGRDASVPGAFDAMGNLFLGKVRPANGLTTRALQKKLEERGLPTHGTKPELMARLHQQTLREVKCRLPRRLPTHNEARQLLPRASVWTGQYRRSGTEPSSPLELHISAVAAPPENHHYNDSADAGRLTVTVLYGSLARHSQPPQEVCVVLSITVDGCVVVRVEELQYSTTQEVLEGEIRRSADGTVIRGRVAEHTAGGRVTYFKDNTFSLKWDPAQAPRATDAPFPAPPAQRQQPQEAAHPQPAPVPARPPPQRAPPEAEAPQPPQPPPNPPQRSVPEPAARRGSLADEATLGRRAAGSTGAEEQWQRFVEQVEAGAYAELTLRDIPFPATPLTLPFAVRRDANRKRAVVRALQLRWHPDKFMQAFGRLLREDQKEEILTKVKDIAQAINGLL